MTTWFIASHKNKFHKYFQTDCFGEEIYLVMHGTDGKQVRHFHEELTSFRAVTEKASKLFTAIIGPLIPQAIVSIPVAELNINVGDIIYIYEIDSNPEVVEDLRRHDFSILRCNVCKKADVS